MSKVPSKTLMKKTRENCKSWDEVAARLGSDGYTNKGGNMLTGSWCCWYSRAKPTAKKRSAKTHENDVVLEILKLKSLSDDDKARLIRLSLS